MKTSYAGRAFIAREEGIVLVAYRDTAGVWTIGVGHTTQAGPPTVAAGLRLTLAECLDLFARDLAKYEAEVGRNVKVPLTQAQFDALVSWHFNTGAVARASLIKKLNAGDYSGAADGLLAWSRAGGRVLEGLRQRRIREQRLFLYGDYGDISKVPVWSGPPASTRPTPMPFPKDTAPEPLPPPPDIPKPAPQPATQSWWRRLLRFLGFNTGDEK
jgi:GH24 family phage-related lysozyme (muramidase)